MASGDDATIKFYDVEAEPYAAARANDRREHPHLAAFAGKLPAGGSVLDLGCGGGQDALAFLNHGFKVNGSDASPKIAREAERRTGIEIRVEGFDELRDSSAFDGVWACASLHHVPAEELPFVFERIHEALKPGGWLYASFKFGKIDRRDRFGRLYCEMDEMLLRSLVADRGHWREPRIEHGKGSGYDNEPIDWLFLTVQRD